MVLWTSAFSSPLRNGGVGRMSQESQRADGPLDQHAVVWFLKSNGSYASVLISASIIIVSKAGRHEANAESQELALSTGFRRSRYPVKSIRPATANLWLRHVAYWYDSAAHSLISDVLLSPTQTCTVGTTHHARVRTWSFRCMSTDSYRYANTLPIHHPGSSLC
ncbi:unnamed protein product [Pleuronectes platessa]|uniref:Uncharacterized protein n=1 Tax=Pleuronectes platessa TaxID=8262 RepID=A0A9N7YYE3_PLEPL|nr:unnamed protein product [Pleuronectes platessa]